jgi:3-carboxy-cis,cis-muconate cycloisomerase
MPAHPADSALYGGLFGDPETARLFTDAAQIRAMLLVEGALARVQGAAGMIPAEAATVIDRMARAVQIDPAALEAETARNGVPVPALVAAFRAQLPAEAGPWLHWGATSQDIMDTAQALRLARLCDLWDARLAALAAALGRLAAAHADLPMAARTYGQAAVPTTFGALVAGWGRPVLRHRAALAGVRAAVAQVSLAGAGGTLSAMGPGGPAIRAALAAALGLADPGAGWHVERDGLAAFAGWCASLAATLGRMGEDLTLFAQTGIGEVRIAGAGESSTMPQKANPVGPAALLALARHAQALAAALQAAALHRQSRDGAAWFAEWLALPPLAVTTGRSLALARDLAGRIAPRPEAMARGLEAEGGAVMAEALTFALAARMPRPEAAATVKRLVAAAAAEGCPLRTVAEAAFPALDWAGEVTGPGWLGTAPADARAFAAAAGG